MLHNYYTIYFFAFCYCYTCSPSTVSFRYTSNSTTFFKISACTSLLSVTTCGATATTACTSSWLWLLFPTHILFRLLLMPMYATLLLLLLLYLLNIDFPMLTLILAVPLFCLHRLLIPAVRHCYIPMFPCPYCSVFSDGKTAIISCGY